MTSTMSRHSHHRSDDTETEPTPATTRIGGVRVMTAGPYLALRAEAQTLTGWRGSRARRRLAAEERRRALAIKRAVDQSGFDVDGAQVPGAYGVAGAGGGRTNVVLQMPEWRTTTAQVAGGFWPFSIGASSPLLGTPLGSHLQTGQDFGCDPLSWFLAGLITAPTAFVLGLNGFGKSSLVRRLAEGNIAQGHTTLFLGDIKPDFAPLTHAFEGQVITGGYGYQQINPLAAGGLGTALMRINAEIADRTARGEDLGNLPDLWNSVSTDLRSRQVQTLAGLLEISRAGRVQDFEETLLSSALHILYTPIEQGGKGFNGAHPPILADLYAVLKEGNETLLEDAAVGADDMFAYAQVTANLRQSLRALIQGPLGKVLNGQTTER
ncbi:hypothetical protein [Gordonia pseudamarae]|uniref:hypothetical protein n=1 Tax=Gordonia pseudamarae TaxID=2831662 RepID=UPI001FE5B02B|nr:hypothetical protein [Gordonia pseudamarae]